MLNHITIMGRLTRDPELRYTQAGQPVASFSVACERDYGNRDTGERQTDFIDCVAWRQTGEFISKYFTKGSMIAVSGRLQIRDWVDRDGGKRRSAEINVDNAYFGESRRRDDNVGQGSSQGNGGRNETSYSSPSSYDGPDSFSEIDDDDGDLPF